MIRFVCECGKQLQAREENAGRLVLCPACQRQQTVPVPPPAGIQPQEPTERTPAEPRVQRQRPTVRDETELEEEDRPRRGSQAGSSGKATASLVLGIVSLCGCSCFTGLPSILFGILSLRDIGQTAGRMTGKPMAVIGIVLGILGTLCWPLVGVPAWYYSRNAAEKATTSNNLKQMTLAMHNYNDVYGALPPAGLGNPMQPNQIAQKPLLSWRVALLPYLEEDILYRQFKLDEPWDSPTNKPLLAKMPKLYKLPGDDKSPSDHTVFQVFTGPGTLFEPNQRMRIPASIPDGTSNTIMIVEAAKGVPWTKPEDIPFDPSKPVLPLVGGHFRGVFLMGMADGSIRMVSQTVSETTLKALITRDGGEIPGPDW